jgi:hypothetical protein
MRATEVSAGEVGAGQVRVDEPGLTEICVAEVRAAQVGTREVRTRQVGTWPDLDHRDPWSLRMIRRAVNSEPSHERAAPSSWWNGSPQSRW